MPVLPKAITAGLFALAVLVFTLSGYPVANAQEAKPAAARAAEMIKARQYQSAIKLLEAQEAHSGKELLMLGESTYQLKDYAASRTWFSRALTLAENEAGRKICESRLALLDYRLGDYRGAAERIENFLRKYPTDGRAGTLLVVQMKIVAAGKVDPAEKLRQLAPLYETITKDRRTLGYYNFVLASNVIAEVHTGAGDPERANAILVEAVHEMNGLLVQMRQEKRPIPGDLMRGFDSMSLQVAKHYIGRKDWNEAEKWLGNVNYVPELTVQAKLVRGQVALARGDAQRVLSTLTEDYLATVPNSDAKSEMRLLRGLAFKKEGDQEAAKAALKLVEEGSKPFAQAQHILGDIYREQDDPSVARGYYERSVTDPGYEAPALFYLGSFDMAEANKADQESEAGIEKAKEWRRSAATRLGKLATDYPLTSYAKQAKPLLDELGLAGISAGGSEPGEIDKVADWEETVRGQPGTNAAAQALVSLAQYFSRESVADDGETVVAAPDWAKVAEFAGLLLRNGETPFAGVASDRWAELRGTMLYLTGRAELASLPKGTHFKPKRGAQPTTIEGGGDPDRAREAFQNAGDLVGTDDQDLQREIELSLVEAMFKSADQAVRRKAEERYAELETEYGSTPRYHKLALDLADWFVERGEYALAADSYRSVSRKGDLDRDQIMHLLYLAGFYFSQAAKDADGAREAESMPGIYIYPKELIATPGILESHPPFLETKGIPWKAGESVLALDVLERVSEEFGVPFVWLPDPYEGGLADYLGNHRIPYAEISQFRVAKSLADYVNLITRDTPFAVDFDLGVTGGVPTLEKPSAELAELDPAAFEKARVIEIYDSRRERFDALTKPYDWAEHQKEQGGKLMMFHVMNRVSDLTGARVIYGETVSRDDLLAREYTDLPGGDKGGQFSVGQVLRKTLEPMELTFRPVRRDVSGELFTEAKDCFNELRKFGADTRYTEKALFMLATNFSHQRDWEKMRLVLREYLKVFDSPSHPHYYDACFWLGWAFENQRQMREALRYYATATEEKVVLFKRDPATGLASQSEVEARLGRETRLLLETPVYGVLEEAPLGGRFRDFVRFHTNIYLDIDPAAEAAAIMVNREAFRDVRCIDLLYSIMREHGLDLRTENADKEIAEKAYYRLASVYSRENMMSEALENVDTLLDRYPTTKREVDALKLRLDIFKGLKDYGKVPDAIAELKAASQGIVPSYKFDYELGRVYFDMRDFQRAADYFKDALGASQDESERLVIREAYAQALTRTTGGATAAEVQYQELAREETGALRASVARLMLRYLRFLQGGSEVKMLSAEEEAYIRKYESLSDEQFAKLDANQYARATWIYYVTGLRDFAADPQRLDAALVKFEAAAKSPDDFLAGEALLLAARIHLQRKDWKKARDTYQYLLFATQSVPAAVDATYYLAMCHEQEGDLDQARARLKEVVAKYPISPVAEKARNHKLMKGGEE